MRLSRDVDGDALERCRRHAEGLGERFELRERGGLLLKVHRLTQLRDLEFHSTAGPLVRIVDKHVASFGKGGIEAVPMLSEGLPDGEWSEARISSELIHADAERRAFAVCNPNKGGCQIGSFRLRC